MHRDQVISVQRQSQLFGGLDDVRLIALPPRSDVMLAEQQAGGAGPAGQPTIDLPLTRTDMANMVGGSRQSVGEQSCCGTWTSCTGVRAFDATSAEGAAV